MGENTTWNVINGVICKCSEIISNVRKNFLLLCNLETYILSTFFNPDNEAGTSVNRLLLSSLKISILIKQTLLMNVIDN